MVGWSEFAWAGWSSGHRHGGDGPHVGVVAVLYVDAHAEARAEAPLHEGAQPGAHGRLGAFDGGAYLCSGLVRDAGDLHLACARGIMV